MSSTVTVACKISNGILMGEDVVILGPNKVQKHMLVGGYAMTHGVPVDVWDDWLEKNQKSTMVEKGLIFAGSIAETRGKAFSKARKGTVAGPQRPQGIFHTPE